MRAPIERIKEKVLKENLWVFILNILAKRPCYAGEMRGLIQKKFGFLAGTVTAYKVLYLLEKGGYVKREGKYYSITASGKTQLKAARDFFITVSKEI